MLLFWFGCYFALYFSCCVVFIVYRLMFQSIDILTGRWNLFAVRRITIHRGNSFEIHMEHAFLHDMSYQNLRTFHKCQYNRRDDLRSLLIFVWFWRNKNRRNVLFPSFQNSEFQSIGNYFLQLNVYSNKNEIYDFSPKRKISGARLICTHVRSLSTRKQNMLRSKRTCLLAI